MDSDLQIVVNVPDLIVILAMMAEETVERVTVAVVPDYLLKCCAAVVAVASVTVLESFVVVKFVNDLDSAIVIVEKDDAVVGQ